MTHATTHSGEPALPPTRAPEPPSRIADAVRTHLDAIARKYDRNLDRVLDSRRRHRFYYDSLARRIAHDVLPGARVLDVGCLEGDLLAALRPAYGVGIDICPAAIDRARRKHAQPHLHFRTLAGEDAAQLSETFDYVILSNVIGEVYDLRILLEALQSVCHPRTRIIIAYYNRVWQPILTLADRIRARTHLTADNWLPPDEINNLLRLTDYETIRQTNALLLPIYVPALSALLNRCLGPLPIVNEFCLHTICVARPRRPARDAVPARRPSVSVVIPARNESGHVRELLDRLPPLGRETEVLFIEGNSTDDTWDVIQRAAADYRGPHRLRTMRQTGRGKGQAVRQAFAEAGGDILIILDADISVTPEELPQFIAALEHGYAEFANGSRLVYPMEKRAMRFLNLLGNKFFGYAFTFLLGQRFRDTLCGTKALYRRDYEILAANRDYFGDFDPFGDFDLLFGAARMSLRIADIPVHYKERRYGETNISRFAHGWLLLKMCAFAARKIKFI